MSAEDIWPPRQRLVGIWLLIVCVFVFAMIMVGGATRLTDSGLSITEWNFMKHFIPPTSEAGWQQEFAAGPADDGIPGAEQRYEPG